MGTLRMHFDVQGRLLASARECEAEIFLRWFGNTREQLEEEYGAYEDDSVFLAIADDDDHVVGAVRLLPPGTCGFKSLDDVNREPWRVDGVRAAAAAGVDLSSTWDVATLGVRAERSGGARVALALYHGLMTGAQVNEMSHFVAILDERVRRLLSSVGILTRPLPGTCTAEYLGSPSSTPVYCEFGPMLDNQRRQFPDAYRLVTLGTGLDGIVVPDREAFRWRPRTRLLDLTAMERRAVASTPR